MIDFAALVEAVEAHTQVVRLVVADVKGSAPREPGTSMLIWDDGILGTIGGGRLEFDAVKTARKLLEDGTAQLVSRIALGPEVDQCCGGSVTLAYEIYNATTLDVAMSGIQDKASYMRQLEQGSHTPPTALLSQVAQAIAQSQPVSTQLSKGWLVEPVWRARLPVFIYGAGHVGRALALMLAPLPQFEVHLCDVREEQFEDLPDNIQKSWTLLPTDVMAHAPQTAAHLIMTPEHEYDLELCHRLLSRSFGYAGLIGSQTKWVRFRKRLIDLGHDDRQIDRIQCPIGDPGLGKHPQAIAIGVTALLLQHQIEQVALLKKTA